MAEQKKYKAGTFFHHICQAARERAESVEDTIAWAVKLGYSAAELDADDLEGTELLAKKGMAVSSIYRNYSWQKGIDKAFMEDHIRIAVRLGASKIMAIPGFYSGKDHDKAELEKMHEGMRQLSELAKENGLTLTIEDYDNALSPIATMDGMQSFLEAAPGLKVTLDTGNFIFSAEDALKAQQKFLPLIVHAHLKDRLWSRKGEGDTLECIDGRILYPCAVCDGDIPIREVMRVLSESGYDGYVVAEHFGSCSYAENMERSILNMRKEGWVE